MSLIRSTRVLLCAAFAAAVAATAAGTDTAESVTADAAAAQSALGQETITRLKKLGAEVRWVDPSKDPVSGPCADMETDFRFHTHWCEHKPSKSAGFEINLVSPGADEKILPEFLRIRPIRGFYLQGMQLTDKSLATIARHPSICGIDLSETNVTDRGLKVIAGLSSLERLSISGTNVSEKGIVFLESLPNLELIDASNSKLSELSLDRGFPKLARIRVSDCPLRSVRLRNLPKFLGLGVDSSSKNVVVDIENLPEFRELVDLSPVSERGRRHVILRNLPKLECAVISSFVREGDLMTFSGLPQLRILELQRVELSDDGLACLGQFPLLEELVIGYTDGATEGRATHKGFDVLRRLPKLRVLKIDSDVEQGLEQIACLKELTKLRLTGSCVCPKTLVALARLKNLRELSLLKSLADCKRGKSKSELEFPEIATMKSLTVLELELRCVSVKTLQAVAQLKSLRHLKLVPWKPHFTTEEISVLETMRNLASLEIGVIGGFDGNAVINLQVEQLRKALPKTWINGKAPLEAEKLERKKHSRVESWRGGVGFDREFRGEFGRVPGTRYVTIGRLREIW